MYERTRHKAVLKFGGVVHCLIQQPRALPRHVYINGVFNDLDEGIIVQGKVRSGGWGRIHSIGDTPEKPPVVFKTPQGRHNSLVMLLMHMKTRRVACST